MTATTNATVALPANLGDGGLGEAACMCRVTLSRHSCPTCARWEVLVADVDARRSEAWHRTARVLPRRQTLLARQAQIDHLLDRLGMIARGAA